MLIFIGRFFYLSVWGFLICNLIFPFSGPAHVIANMALIGLVILHTLQTLLYVSLTANEKPRDRYRIFRLFLFGIFETLSWNKSKKQQ